MNKKKVIKKNLNASKTERSKFNKLLVLVLILLTVSVYYQSLNNKFVPTWDDNKYVVDNNEIKSFHGDSLKSTLKTIFTTNVAGNYHPLTMLSYCFEYGSFKLNPGPYHTTNLIFHLFNVLLVLAFIWLLTRQQWVAFITAMLFAIHPMHVESVAWISERKDVLYSFFFLAALCVYLLYLDSEKKKLQYYIFMLLLFIAALLSKGMAVSLPVVFFAIDYFKGRKFNMKLIVEKLPFLVAAGIFGYVAIQAQSAAKAMDDLTTIASNFSDLILYPCYGVVMYLWKLVVPADLSCHYPYPVKVNGNLPTMYYVSPFIILGLAFLIYKSKKFGKDIIFGFGFFIITIALVLQFISVGSAIIADRYTYLPYIGLFFILARLINKAIEDKTGKLSGWKVPVAGVLVIFSVICIYLSVQRCKVWENDFTLWTDAISKFKDDQFALNSRGDAYFYQGQYDQAIADYSQAIRLKNTHAYYNRGQAYYKTKRVAEALNDFTKSVEYDPTFARGYSMRAIIYTDANNFDAALSDYAKALQYMPDNAIAYHNRGILYKKNNRFPEALENFNEAIKYKPDYAEAYNNRGFVLRSLQRNDEALSDYNQAINLQPNFAKPYYNRGMLEYETGNKEGGCRDIQKAAGLGLQSALDSFNSLCK